MTTAVFFGVTCTCLVVGIYFFFVRSRSEKSISERQP